MPHAPGVNLINSEVLCYSSCLNTVKVDKVPKSTKHTISSSKPLHEQLLQSLREEGLEADMGPGPLVVQTGSSMLTQGRCCVQVTVGLCCAQQAELTHCHMTRQLTDRMKGSECKLPVPLCNG